MASIGHIAVGLAAARAHGNTPAFARPRRSSILFWLALSMLPDADVLAFAFGVDYAAPWGHRGATHSLIFAVAVAAVAALAAPRFGFRGGRTLLVATVVMVSHGLLDTLTDGGLGCALLWPFNLTRYFAPWLLIPVSPIGLAFLSPYGLFVAITELVLFAPLLIYALRPRLKRRFWLPPWIAAVWLIGSSDPIRNAVLGLALREDTRYAPGFSEEEFQTIAAGASDVTVRHALGAPIGVWLDFETRTPDGCPYVYFEADRVSGADLIQPCADRGIGPGLTAAEVIAVLGPPQSECWRYTDSPTHRFHRARGVCFSDGKVRDVVRQWQAF